MGNKCGIFTSIVKDNFISLKTLKDIPLTSRQVSRVEAEDFATKKDMRYFETRYIISLSLFRHHLLTPNTSVLTATGIDEPFEYHTHCTTWGFLSYVIPVTSCNRYLLETVMEYGNKENKKDVKGGLLSFGKAADANPELRRVSSFCLYCSLRINFVIFDTEYIISALNDVPVYGKGDVTATVDWLVPKHK